MSNKPTPRVRVPATAKKDEIIEIKTLISHEMESGQRKGADGNVIPRRIINTFTASFNGKKFFEATWHPARTEIRCRVALPQPAMILRFEDS